MLSFIKIFERYIIIALLLMMLLVVLLSTIELGWILVEQMLKPPRFILLNFNELIHIFGFFLVVLIGIELLETMKVYLEEKKVNVEIMFLVAMIAITRKVVIMDINEVGPMGVFSIAAIILALSVGYYALKKVSPGSSTN